MEIQDNFSPDVHINLNVRGLTLSATLAINELSAKMQYEGHKVYRLGLGQSPFPVPQPVVDALKVNARQKDYMPVRGLRELCDSVSGYIRRNQGIEISGQDVLVGPGSKELMFLLQLVYYGDLVIPTPSWVSYVPQAHIIGRHVRRLTTHYKDLWRLMPDDLEKLCIKDPDRPRLVILNYPANPTGRTYNVDELQELAKIARKYRVILLSDEIYGELHYEGQHISIARFYPEGTIISTGLSKWCGAGGWRLGTFIFPRSLQWLLEAMAVVASETYTATSAPIQYAAVRAFQGGIKIEQYLWNARRILKSLGMYYMQTLKDTGVIVAEPQGAFYLFPDFAPFKEKFQSMGIHTSDLFCERVLGDTGVALLPGTVFGQPSEELTVRIAFVDFDGARALAAAEQYPPNQSLDMNFLKDYCTNTTMAVEVLCDWLKRMN